ncbi:hypothetical protein [Sphingopyxis macrogoltabida]|uniref:Preprotein translocase subunit YajC n=1 Tax=Sphingopyxis macrogoltabida TaxID=33050 RepID=A0A0N9V6E1_SPHMC|nr:hypothetical protein [Sphingopyxis macrogoltabida]ALH79647.1 hypothetical protein AN936_04475 [Sphingopyxis macrogoltabida]
MRTKITMRRVGTLAALLLAGTATSAHAQFSGDPGSDGDAPSAGGPAASSSEGGRSEARAERRRAKKQVNVSPYLEVGQVLSADLKGDGDVLTYTTLAAGVDASIVTRRAELAGSVRYEYRIGESGGLGNSSSLSGLARGRIEAARGLNLEAGALATRTRADGYGGDTGVFLRDGTNVSNLYSVYAGPTFARRIGGLDVGAGYRFGYTKIDVDDPTPPGVTAQDIFDSSTNHVAWASVGARPGDLPFGWQVSGGYQREDASQLDQRYEGKFARADVTVPIGPTLALLGGLGYEDIEIGQRDPVVDANGVPVRDANGRFITDKSKPRELSFDTDGLIWDAGVMWQPNRRTALTAKVGRRYGDTIYTGSFTYRANHATLSVGVYDGLSSFGRGLSGGLAALPTQFDPIRNPVDGSINPCVFGDQGGGCLANQLGNTTTAQFRNRGVQAVFSSRLGGWSYGIGAGYDRRKLLLPSLSAIADLNGVIDENYYLFLSAGRQLDRDSDLTLAAYYNYFDNGAPGAANVQSAGISAAYSRRLWRGLTGHAAASLTAFDQEGFNSELIGSALVGMRYSF